MLWKEIYKGKSLYVKLYCCLGLSRIQNYGRVKSINNNSWKGELSFLSLAIHVNHPRYFCLTSWLHQKLPWSFLLCFFVFFLLYSYWLHLYPFFDFLKERRLKKLSLSIPTGPIKSENSHLTFLSFLLRKELKALLSPRGHTPKER